MLWDGAEKLGWGPQLIRRNVKGCARLGYCGMGCPLDAKQSALITYVPDAVAAGAELYANCRVRKLERDGAPHHRGGTPRCWTRRPDRPRRPAS